MHTRDSFVRQRLRFSEGLRGGGDGENSSSSSDDFAFLVDARSSVEDVDAYFQEREGLHERLKRSRKEGEQRTGRDGTNGDLDTLGVGAGIPFRSENDRDREFLLHLDFDAIQSVFDAGL